MNETHKKYPEISVALSFIFPGAGQLYNEEYAKGIILIVATLLIIVYSGISLGSEFINSVYLLRTDLIMRILVSSLICFGIWLYGIIDGAVGAFKHTLTNTDHSQSASPSKKGFIVFGALLIIIGIVGVFNLLGIHFSIFIKYSWPVAFILLGCYLLAKSTGFLKGAK
ncbi:MAG TPA: hypothetical protein DDW50_05115 [Firmicutes bacterium]|jgi:hypothetical protein|nr:hypothetical protein [Bacillota bacterium]